jgi:hypothetical protein
MSEIKKEETKVQTDADLIRENAMLKAELEARKNQIKQATDLFNRLTAEKTATEEAEKQRLIDTIMQDSTYQKDQLIGKDMNTLREINTTLNLNNNKAFASVAADMAEQAHKAKVHLTVGAWDAQKKVWIGGL